VLGQNVNKVETKVQLFTNPQEFKSSVQKRDRNKTTDNAMQMLRSQLYEIELKETGAAC
jgi:protein subunit release factor B